MIRQYLSPIAMSVGASLLIVLLSAVPYAIYNYRKRGKVPVKRTLVGYSFIWYLVAAYFLVILPLPSRESVEAMNTPHYNLEPFIFVEHFLRYSGIDLSDPGSYPRALLQPTAYTVYFNLILTIPLGIYLRKFFGFNFIKTLLAGFSLSLFFEITQLTGLYGVYPRPYRIFNVDDLMVNSLGAALGYVVAPIFKGWTPEVEKDRAFENAKEVTFPRRILAFGMDIAIITGLYPMGSFILQNLGMDLGRGGFSFAITFILSGLYFMGSTIILRRTPGMALVKVKIHGGKDRSLTPFRMVLRHLLFLLWFPGSLALLEVTRLGEPYLSLLYLFVFVLMGSGFVHMGYSVLKKERRLLHERITNTTLRSLN